MSWCLAGFLVVSWLFLCGLWVVIRSCLGGVSVVSLVSRWCLGGFLVVIRSCLGGFLMVSWWCLGGVLSRQHHQQNTINIIINTTQHYQHRGPGKSARLNTVDARCVCVAGAALRAPQFHFASQAQHLEHLSLILRGRCSTWSTSREVRGSPARIE